MKTTELQVLWTDWLSTADKLTSILHEQTAALTLRDVNRIERIQPELDTLMSKMQEIDNRAVACCQGLADTLGTAPQVRSLAGVLEKAEAQAVQSLANKVIVTARRVQGLVEKNRSLIDNELVYINGTLTLIAKAAQRQDSPFGALPTHAAVLIDQAA